MIQDRVDTAHRALTETVFNLDANRIGISVSLPAFEALLVLFGQHEVTVASYEHREGRFMQIPSQRVSDCYVAVSTDEVPNIPDGIKKAAVAWGACPHCGDAMFVYSPTFENALVHLGLYGAAPLEVVLP